MGVPKFFRFISERYPLINTAFPSLPPQIDNLYLDMNGIIHNCVRSSPSSSSSSSSKRYSNQIPSAPRSSQDIFLDVFKYIDNLVNLAKPKKVLYLAVDGVAPRAKMNQQRARRFRSAKERTEEHEKKLKEDSIYKSLNKEPFDSNCITPGTPFMHSLTKALRYYIHKKITEDPLWNSLDSVILSGPESPGEGEHKIMEYIRALRESNHLDSNTRHCVYGLDADLIMLALVTHEPHFFLLREKVDFASFWRKKNGPRLASSLDLVSFGDFELLSIGVLREYLALELGADGNSQLPFFDIERLYDDFVFILMLIGNDFLPNLPTLDIADGTLTVMLHLYKRILPLMGGYLTSEGTISVNRFQLFSAKLAMIEYEVLRHRKEQQQHQQQSSSSDRRRRGGPRSLAYSASDLDDLYNLYVPELGSDKNYLLPPPLTETQMKQEIATCQALLDNNIELEEMKNDYYTEKFGKGFTDSSSNGLNNLVESYIEGISWTLKYYTEGCRRWHWYFPYHYAPLASDIISIDLWKTLNTCENNIQTDTPFQPWQQLLSVLPPSSSWCLPGAYRKFMTSSTSPISEFYPDHFEVDLNGKRNDWEAVVLLPFIDEDLLTSTMKSIPREELTEEELAQNELGPTLLYEYSSSLSTNSNDSKQHQLIESPFPSRLASFHSKAKCTAMTLPFIGEGVPFSSSLQDSTLPAISFPDLPTLKQYRIESADLMHVAVNVFGTPSRGDSLLLKLSKNPLKSTYGILGNEKDDENKNSTEEDEDGDMNSDETISGNDDDVFDFPKSRKNTKKARKEAGSNSGEDVEIRATSILSKRGVAIGFSAWCGFPWRKACSIQSIATPSTTFSLDGGIIVSRPTTLENFAQASNSVLSTLVQKSAIDVRKPNIIIGVREEGGTDKATSNKTSNYPSKQNNNNKEDNEIIYLHEYFVWQRYSQGNNANVVGWEALNSKNNSTNENSNMISKGQTVLYVGHGAYFGHLCTTLSTASNVTVVKVKFDHAVGAAREPPFGYRIVSSSNSQRWLSLSRLASEVGMTVPILDAVLGSLRIRLKCERAEVDIGIGAKYIARALYVPGYARKDDRHHYSFSEKCAQLLKKYVKTFPSIFSGISKILQHGRGAGSSGGQSSSGGSGSVFAAEDILPGVVGSSVDDAFKSVQTWLAVQEIAHVPLVNTRSEVLPRDTVKELEKHTQVMKVLRSEYESSLTGGDATKLTKEVSRVSILTGREGLNFTNPSDMTSQFNQYNMQSTFSSFANSSSSGQYLYPNNPNVHVTGSPLHFDPVPMSAAGLRLGDRVVNRLAGNGVPFGLRGSVVGVHPSSNSDRQSNISHSFNVNGNEITSSKFDNNSTNDSNEANVAHVEVMFDEGFIGGGSLDGRCSEGRGKAVPAHSLFIIRPERDNAYYSRQYARVAARLNASNNKSSANMEEKEKMQNEETIATAAVEQFKDILNSSNSKRKEKDRVIKEEIVVIRHGVNRHDQRQQYNQKLSRDIKEENVEVKIKLENESPQADDIETEIETDTGTGNERDVFESQARMIQLAKAPVNQYDSKRKGVVEELAAAVALAEAKADAEENAKENAKAKARVEMPVKDKERGHKVEAARTSPVKLKAKPKIEHRLEGGDDTSLPLPSFSKRKAVGVSSASGSTGSRSFTPRGGSTKGPTQNEVGSASGSEYTYGRNKKERERIHRGTVVANRQAASKRKSDGQAGRQIRSSISSEKVEEDPEKSKEAEILAKALLKQLQVKEEDANEIVDASNWSSRTREAGGKVKEVRRGKRGTLRNDDDEYVTKWQELQNEASASVNSPNK